MAIGPFPYLGLLEAVTWISLGDTFQFLHQCIILLKNQVLNSDNGHDHFNIMLNSFFFPIYYTWYNLRYHIKMKK